ncbi:MAG: glycosyltransferase [Nitrososphaerota archaeon]|nr:glycosyltransferase [Nitrososphaerota archaeon]
MVRNLSIIIPTYNRAPILAKVLRAYGSQTAEAGILEILVADDGSTDETAAVVEQFSSKFRFPVRHLRLEHGGLAKTRNSAIREARGELLLLGDDDIIPAPHFVAEHLAWHEKYPDLHDGVLGRVVLSSELRPTAFMVWLHDEMLFNFSSSPSGLLDPPSYLFGITSVKREFLLQNGMFDEDFKEYGFEDIELGHRLSKVGYRVFYNPAAVGYHYKKMSLAYAWRHAELVETARPHFLAKIEANEMIAPRPETATRKTLRKLVQAVMPFFSPVIWLFDTPIPLPRFVYRLFYLQYILPRVRAGLSAASR